MYKLKRICAAMLSAVMITGTLVCGNVGALSTNSTSNFENKISQQIIYPKETKNNKEKDYVEGEVVVMMKDSNLVSTGASLNSVMDVSSNIKVESSSNFNEKRDNFSVVTVSSKKLSTEDILDELKGQEDVLIAEPNYIYKASSITNDTYSDFQWSLENKGKNNGTVGEDIKPASMWAKQSTSKETPVVAVVDTGVDFNHEDLKDKMWVNPYQKKLKGVHGIDCSGTIVTGEPTDDNGHGTHCAGIIAAQRDNNKGISGVADNVKIMALKFLDSDGSGSTGNAVVAYNYIYNAMKLGVNVVAINNSWGGYEKSEILLSLINKVGKAGAVSVCAAGNDGIDFDAEREYLGESDVDDDFDFFANSKLDYENEEDYDTLYTYPACYDSKYIISVAATGEDGKIALYSNRGKNSVDIAAPGSDILSTVSYDSFLPTIYSKDKINDVCQQYITKDFNATVADLGKKQGSGTVNLSETNYGYDDGLGDSTSLDINISVNKNNEGVFAVEIPYTATSNGSKGIYTSLMVNLAKSTTADSDSLLPSLCNMYFFDIAKDEELKLDELYDLDLSGVSFYGGSTDWSHFASNTLTPKNVTGERKMVLLFDLYSEGNYTFRVDNIGFSKGTNNETELFGKYDIYSGTSMATPCVTGSVALIKDKYNDLSTEDLISSVNNSVNQNTLVDQITKSNGIISLDKYGSHIPKIQSWTANGNKTVVKGSDFKNITKVTVNGNEVKYTVKNATELTINDNSYFGGVCNLKIYSKDGYGCYTSLFLKGTKYADKGVMDSETIYNYDFASDGKYLYNLDDNYNIVRYNISKKGVLEINKTCSFEKTLTDYYKEITNESSVLIQTSSPIYYNGKIYFVADYYLTLEESNFSYMSRHAVVTFDVSTCKYSVKEIDDIELSCQSIAFYNKEMYLLGGYNMESGTFAKDVYKYSSSKWQKVASLPSGRAMGKCVQFGNKLVYTLGVSDSDECPKNLIYDGKAWTESKSKLGIKKSTVVEIDSKYFTKYSCGVDLVTNGILYTGEIFGNNGDTVVYNPNTDSYSAMNYYFHTDSLNGVKGAVVGNKFYGKGYLNNIAHTYSFNVKTGMYNVAVTSKYGKVTGGGYYMPNTVATVSATPNKNYKVKSIVVNGKTYNKSKVQFTVTKDTTVKVNYVAKVTKVTKVKLNKTSLTMKKGKTYQLKATVTPSNATNKKVTWTSTKKSVATVNSKGKVKAVKKGKCSIKCTAKDGSKKSATCKVTVK